jgi:FkbM family methyltransferase
MKKSQLLLATASWYPCIGAATVRAWSEFGIRRVGAPHWLLAELIEQNQVRPKKTFRLEDGSKLVADPFSYIGEQLLESGVYEPETVGVFRAVVRPGMVVADIGANIGYHTVILAKRVGRKGAVHAFEPDADTYQELVANVRRNRCAHVHCSGLALSAVSGRQSLYLGLDSVNSALRPNLHSGTATVAVETITLDTYVSRAGLNRLDLLKIDVEGAERLVLEGGVRTLNNFRPMLIVELSVHSDVFGYSARDLCSYIAEQAYTLFSIGLRPMRLFAEVPDDFEFCNVFAVPNESIAALSARGVVCTEATRG